MHIHLYMEIYEYVHNCKNFFWPSSNHTVQVCSIHKHSCFLFWFGLFLLLVLFWFLFPSNTPALQAVFRFQTFKVMFCCFIFSSTKLSHVNNSFLMLSPNPIFSLTSHTPSFQKCLFEKEVGLFFSACL